MAFYNMKRIQYAVLAVSGILLAVFMTAGCVADKTQTAQPVEQKQSQTTPDQPVPAVDRQVNAVLLETEGEMIRVRIQGNRKLPFSSLMQDFPYGIAVYLPGTRIGSDLTKAFTNNDKISDVVTGYADKDESMAKVEILLKTDLSYDAVEDDNAIVVTLWDKPDSSQVINAVTSGKTPDASSGSRLPVQESAAPVIVPDSTATMTHIEFNTMEDGKSDIIVHTNQPVKYDTAQKGYDTIYLNLYNTKIPDYHKRPLLTQYFKSAVESLMPFQVPGKGKDSKIEIKIRQAVPYQIVQNQNTILLSFEPSTITPPVFDKAKKKVSSATQTVQTVQDPASWTDAASSSGQPGPVKEEKTKESEFFLNQKVFTGEKIKLDFFETDIKNVFRILRSVGGKNFAIDKDVEGKVTLTLEDPVPWDQVLDLVLKMNNLGMKQEGNVIRIATLDTLKREEKLIQEAIAARKKTIEDSKTLEPLVTEYIPINYSDAVTDIQPHIEKILTPDRGKLSVNTRTNMVIITDVQAKIDQAKEIIFRLDKVTPQIMIEAKVVEVTKDFSRELGMGFSFNRTQTANTGNNEDFSIALNHPTSSPATDLSFNFYRLLGSDFLNLKAQLTASESKGDIKVVSSPRILTLDNKKAKIKQGLEYAYLERDDAGGSSVKFKNIDLLLEVTPHVTPDRRIAMTVYLTKNDIDTVTNGVPSLATNEAETELLVNNNDTVVIGGIVKTTDNESTSGTPVLSGIPILGRLFRTDINKDKRNELLIFLTPSIVQLEQRQNTFTSPN